MTTTEFQLTNGIKELGISRVYTGFNGNPDEIMLFVKRADLDKPLSCKFAKRFKDIAEELEIVLCNSGLDKKTAKKFRTASDPLLDLCCTISTLT